MNDFSIRSARSGDEPLIHQAHMRSIREVCIKDHGIEEIKGWGYSELGNRWVDAIQSGGIWVIERHDSIFGFGYIKIFKLDECPKAYLNALYLTPEALGKGLATQLMRWMLEKAKSSGASGVDLVSSITAHNFYKKFGFVDSGPMKRISIGGYPVTAYPMHLDFFNLVID